jgi:hypothetical protein
MSRGFYHTVSDIIRIPASLDDLVHGAHAAVTQAIADILQRRSQTLVIRHIRPGLVASAAGAHPNMVI